MSQLTAGDLRGTLLIRDCLAAEGGFLLVQLIKAALSDGAEPPARRVVLLAAQQAASHYALVLRKAGLHLPSLLDAGRLLIVDLLPSLGAATLPCLQNLHQQLATAVAAGGGSGISAGNPAGVCLVADDLAVLHCLASSAADWAAFLQACTCMGQAPSCCFIGLAHGDVAADEGWLARLEHAATLVLDVEPLESGRSTDTTGRVVTTRRDVPPTAVAAAAAGAGAAWRAPPFAEARPGTRVCYYKLAESGASYAQHAM